MIKILHTSDLHGDFHKVLNVLEPFDLWIDSGDFFPNESRGHRKTEERFQADWMQSENIPAQVAAWLAGRPMLSVGGNHDFVGLASILRGAGVDAHEITPEGITVAGLRFAGFREVPWIDGEWAGETHDFSGVVTATFDAQPDVLVTHAPPAGLLDYADSAGCLGVSTLASALFWRKHAIRAHFFGHIHEWGGHVVHDAGVYFANGAGSARVHVVSW